MLKVAPALERSSYDWIEYFYQNAPEPALPWNDPQRLSGAEKRAVARSIQQFQLGENASGERLLFGAQQFAAVSGDRGFVPALRLFIREEQRHSRILAQFLQAEGVECLRRHWVHRAFRRIRGVAGAELCLKVLATAEVIARPYYAALRDATGSTLLRQICEVILNEEGAHLRFQAFAVRQFQRGRTAAVQELLKHAHLGFLLCTAVLVWIEHGPVFKAAGRNFVSFWRESVLEFYAMYEQAEA
jgi:hypothetical protein